VLSLGCEYDMTSLGYDMTSLTYTHELVTHRDYKSERISIMFPPIPYFVLRIFSTLWIACALSMAQTSPSAGSYPTMYNIAVGCPVATTPAQSTCGVQTLGAFCKSSTSVSSITTCVLAQCSEDCPYRTVTPPYILLLSANGYGVCVNPDAVNVRPGSPPSSVSVLFLAVSSTCYLVPTSVAVIGPGGACTVTFWVWLNTNGTG